MDINAWFEVLFQVPYAFAPLGVAVVSVVLMVCTMVRGEWRASRTLAAVAGFFLGLAGLMLPYEVLWLVAGGTCVVCGICLLLFWLSGIREDRQGVRNYEDERRPQG